MRDSVSFFGEKNVLSVRHPLSLVANVRKINRSLDTETPVRRSSLSGHGQTKLWTEIPSLGHALLFFSSAFLKRIILKTKLNKFVYKQ